MINNKHVMFMLENVNKFSDKNGKRSYLQFHSLIYISISVVSHLIQDSMFDRPISKILSSADINYNTKNTWNDTLDTRKPIQITSKNM